MPDDASDEALILKFVGDIAGRFNVPRYQRGYRWGKTEVERLLNDIWDNGAGPYNLQPIVVKSQGENQWELVDGQQRLTTLYLIFLYMRRENLQAEGPPFSIGFETRPGSENYLNELNPEQMDQNIDFHHLFTAYECIRFWFEAHKTRRQNVANRFYGYLFDNVRVIWYEAPAHMDSTTLFIRLNVGRIPLTDAELVKALLLSGLRGAGLGADRSREVAAQWDAIERDLRNPDVWAFVTTKHPDECPTRITLLLDTIAGGLQDAERPLFHTFDVLREKMKEDQGGSLSVWNQVLDLHALVLGWFENRDLYHKIGYLVACDFPFEELVSLARNKTKREFEGDLDNIIRTELNLTQTELLELTYESQSNKEKCERLLLLMNVETIRRMVNSTERYPFGLHSTESWSLEHIHAQQTDSLNKAEQWEEWLRLHRNALENLSSLEPVRRQSLLDRIDAAQGRINSVNFQEIARDVTAAFTLADRPEGVNIYSTHSVANLALISSGHNSTIGNSVFEVKRQLILELDRTGAYIPVCTRRVFLKYYSGADAQQIHFWGPQDRDSYLSAMISAENGIVLPYLNPEEPVP